MKAILYLLTLLVAVSASAWICSSVYAQPGNGKYEGRMNTVSLGKTLVVYYSFSGNTRGIAEYIAQKTDGTHFGYIRADVALPNVESAWLAAIRRDKQWR
ncbi:MAG: hypothetical protein LBL72_03415 [Candidatus Accumulibacter sp.]|jgi:hypothetical protein|nr:hypothetical protein [Accumulibacter sp.]